MSERYPNRPDIEIRGELDPSQRRVCEQLTDVLTELPGVEIQAVGISPNMVVAGGTESPCVWFKVDEGAQEYQIAAAINTFRGRKVGVVSNFHFGHHRDLVDVRPFGATLGMYILPSVEINLEDI